MQGTSESVQHFTLSGFVALVYVEGERARDGCSLGRIHNPLFVDELACSGYRAIECLLVVAKAATELTHSRIARLWIARNVQVVAVVAVLFARAESLARDRRGVESIIGSTDCAEFA